MRLGGVVGAFTGLMVASLRGAPCCASPPHPPLPFGDIFIDGLIAALIVSVFASAFAVLVTHRPASVLFPLGFLLAVLIALFVSDLAYWLGHHLAVAILVALLIGAFIGWIVCRLWCGRGLVGIAG
jgi:hypothetical protein